MEDQGRRKSSDSTVQKEIQAYNGANLTVEEVVGSCFGHLDEHLTPTDLEDALIKLRSRLAGSNPLRTRMVRRLAIQTLANLGVKHPAKDVDAALSPFLDHKSNGSEQSQVEPEPWPEYVDGANLLEEIQAWLEAYVVIPKEAAAALALWSVATWFVTVAYFAPILVLQSPTKQSGKTLVLDLLQWICRRAELTSGVGVTSAVIFRINERSQPTFLIDEAEKLSGRHADKEIIGLLNQGYRRGGRVRRLREKNGDYVVEQFDAFGFRALAAIGSLWDTIIDRAIVISMKRKPKAEKRRRFISRIVEDEGKESARRICRFAQDSLEAFDELQESTPRPQWLNDRACDNWSPLFAVAQLAGGDWLKKALDAAKLLSTAVEDGDRAEQLIHDTRQILTDKGEPEVIKSGDLVQALNEIESSPWGDCNKGNGITAHKVAAMFKPFEIRPDQGRVRNGDVVRGYWLKDLTSVFERYPPRTELVQLVQPSNNGPSRDPQTGTKNEPRTTSNSARTPTNTGLYQLYQSEEGEPDTKVFEGDL